MTSDPSVTTQNAAHWAAVEEATELLHEERFREAMVELRRVLREDAKNPYAFYFLGVAFFEVGELEAARDAYAASRFSGSALDSSTAHREPKRRAGSTMCLSQTTFS